MAALNLEVWHVGLDYLSGIPVYRDGEIHFATVFKSDDAGADAERARVLAAAPEMLETLHRIACGLEADGRTADGITKAAAAKLARAAIAKAEGRAT